MIIGDEQDGLNYSSEVIGTLKCQCPLYLNLAHISHNYELSHCVRSL